MTVVVLSLALSGCVPSTATEVNEKDITFIQFQQPDEGQDMVIIKTTQGTIKMVLFPKEAPNTVAHFKKLVSEGYYDNKILFRQSTVQTALITGGEDEYGSTGKLVTSDGKPLKQEINPNLWHFSGAVSTVGYTKNKFSKTMLSDSRFFIVGTTPATREMADELEKHKYPLKVINAYKEHGGFPQYTKTYTVFGHVIEGLDVVDKLNKLETNSENNQIKNEKIISAKLSSFKIADFPDLVFEEKPLVTSSEEDFE